jgi:hypothetical protein
MIYDPYIGAICYSLHSEIVVASSFEFELTGNNSFRTDGVYWYA